MHCFYHSDANKRKIRAKAAFSYAPENEDELSLEIGDVVEITKQVSTYLGKTNNFVFLYLSTELYMFSIEIIINCSVFLIWKKKFKSYHLKHSNSSTWLICVWIWGAIQYTVIMIITSISITSCWGPNNHYRIRV